MTTRPAIPGHAAGLRPRLHATRIPTAPTAVVLILHGGDGDGASPVRPWQPAVARMIPLAAHIARHVRNIAVLRLVNAARGLGPEPTANLEWALARIQARLPNTPVLLVGHSLGGSVVLAAAGRENVRAVVALAPWLAGTESADVPPGTRVLLVHGSRDRVTDPQLSRQYVARSQAGGAAASFIDVQRGGHAMLHRASVFHCVCSAYIRATVDKGHRPGSRVESVAASALTSAGEYRL